jgi:glycosyltransferase involved in cell wall biosynthesis
MIGGVDLFFMPNIIFGSVSEKTKLIITIHDLSFEHYPESFSLKRRLWHVFVNPKKICQKADGIVVVSESTKNDLVRIYKINPRKIEVIYSAVSEKFSVISRNDKKMIEVKEKYKLPYKFILYLGTIEPRKNIIGIIKFFNDLQKIGLSENKYKELLDYKLIIAGSKGWLSKKVFSELKKSEFKSSIRFVNYIPDSDKEYFFNLASLFVYPSLFEGFGFPVLEAMSCGVPVITSNVSSLPEIVADAAVMIDPNKPQEITEAAIKIILNKEFRENLIKKGINQAKKFNWQESAKNFIAFGKKKRKKA